MSHLKPEALARLVDEAPEGSEAEHLEKCAACRACHQELMKQTAELAGLPAIQPPGGAWDSLKARLTAEGLLQPGAIGRATGTGAGDVHASSGAGSVNGAGNEQGADDGRWKWPSFMRVAAAAAFFVLGGLTGYAIAGPGSGMTAAGDVPAAESGGELASGDERPGATEANTGLSDRAESEQGAFEWPGTGEALPEATRALREAEAGYFAAMKNYTVASGNIDSPDPLTRLAALQNIVLTTRAALDDAPADPVINGYHLTALAQRDGILESFAMSDEEEVWF